MSEGLQQQIANLNAAQRVGIVAAVALSSFAVYATKKHKNICGGPVDSPRHRDACPLHFLTCAPNNDINSSIANIQDTLASAASTANESLNTIAQTANTALADFDMDPSHWKLPDLPTVSLPSIPTIRCPPEPLLGCAHDEGFFTHPHSQSCLQCNHSHRASNILDRGYLDWSTWSSPADDSPSEPDSPQQLESYSLLDCPVQHQNTFDESAPTCSSCEEERSQSSSPGSRSSASSAMSSIKSMVSRLGRDAVNLNLNLSEAPLVGDAARMIAAVGSGVTSSMGSMADAARSGAVGGSRDGAVGRRAGLGRTALYFFFWYLCTLCNDQFRIKNKGTILARFPAPHLLQAFGFAFQYYFVQELQKHKFNFFPAPTNHYTWTSNMNIVIPIAIAASFDIALELNQGGSDDQFNKLCKSTSPLFILILTYILNFETPTFKLTTSIASITTGSLLTIAKALDYNYELPDVLALMTGAFFSASRWIGAQYLLQKEDNGSPIVTMGRMAPWMAICILVFSIIFEKSWLMITRIDYFFESPIDMLEGLGQLLIFYVLWTLEILADFLLITNTGAITFIVAKLLKTVGDLGTEIFKKGFYYEERHWIERKKIMNEETIGLHYIGFGLVLFLWHRYQNWASNRGGGGGADGSGGASRGRSNSSSGGGAYGGLDGHGGGGGGEDGGAGANGGGSGGGSGGGGGGGHGGACGGLCGGACACGRGAECSAGSCAGSCGRGAECSARPEAGDASQCAAPREVVTEPACPKQC